jgi:predicted KAP-like P-loop ATPase
MTHYSLSPDLPIESAKEDRLNRSRFAEGLATAIKNWSQPSSLVIALYGDWGSGKSSLKNMVLESLRDGLEPNQSIRVIEFNPWQISNQEGLSRAFFDELGGVLGTPTSGESTANAERRAAKWRTYSSYFSIGTSITKSLKVILPLLGVPFVADALDSLADGLEKSGTLAKEGAEGIESSGKATRNSLSDLKREVADELKQLSQPILVVLDDVDRLAQDEIRLLFQLIKANADFPNLVYLVLAQRESVVEALEAIAPGRGDAFLEKIVQVGFNVPRLQQRQLEHILFSGLDRLLADEVVGKRFEKEHWIKLYRDGLRHFFTNLRDVNRYLSSLGFHFGVFRSAKAFEVNPVDLIGLEVLRVFVPSLYNALPDAKHILTDEPRFMREEEKKQDAAIVEAMINSVSENDRAAAQHILEVLFPPASSLLAGSYFDGTGSENWFPELRISSHEVFDRYFHFATPPGDLSQAELDEVFEIAGSYEALREKLKELESRSLLDVLLDRLDSYKDKLPLEHAVPFITALLDLDVDADDEFFLAHFSPQTHIKRIIYWYVRREPNEQRRREILLQAISGSSGLAGPAHLASWLKSEVSATRPTDPDAILQKHEDIEAVRNAVTEKITGAAASGRLVRERQLRLLLSVWHAWGIPDEAKRWTSKLVETQAGICQFLQIMRSTTRSYGGPIPKDYHYYKLSSIEHFIPANDLAVMIEALDHKELTEEDSKNLRLFQKALDRRKKGLPELTFMDVHDE